MSMIFRCLGPVLILLVSSGIATFAQPPLRPMGPTPGFVPVPGALPVHGRYWGGSSTVGESHARGMSRLIQARASANLTNASAATQLEDARSRSLDNRQQYVQNYYDRKRIRDEYMAERNQRFSQSYQRRSSSSDRYSKPLSIVGMDSIDWPPMLLADEFSDKRQTFDLAVASLADDGMLTNDLELAVSRVSRIWRQQLIARRSQYDSDELREGVRFIVELEKQLDT